MFAKTKFKKNLDLAQQILIDTLLYLYIIISFHTNCHCLLYFDSEKKINHCSTYIQYYTTNERMNEIESKKKKNENKK